MATNRVTTAGIQVLNSGNATVYVSTAGIQVLRSVSETTSTSISVGAGSLSFTGKSVSISSALSLAVGAGSLSFTGQGLTFSEAVTLSVGAGALTFTGKGASLYVPPAAFVRGTQYGLYVLAKQSPAPDANVTQYGLNTLAKVSVNVRETQMGLLVLAKGSALPTQPEKLNLLGSGRSKVVNLRVSNMYYEETPDGPGPDARFGRPGLDNLVQRGAGPVYAVFQWQGYTFSVSGSTVWRDSTNIGSITVGSDVRWATSETQIVIVSNGAAYLVTLDDVTQIADPDLPDYIIDVGYADGRFLYLGKDTGKWWWSDVGDAASIDGLSFATAESAPDPLTGVISVQDSFVLFGTQTAEWWYATGVVDAPFQRSNGRRYDKGCVARETIRSADNTGYFLGNDRVVYRMGDVPQRVSTYDVEDHIRRVSDADITSAWAFVTWFGGHTFYVLSLPGQSTWAYDISQNKWQEWTSWEKDNFRVRSSFGPLLGDLYTGKIMQFNQDLYTDLGDPIVRVTSAYLPLRSGSLRNFNLMLGTIRGVGTVYGGDEPNPVVEMRFSDNEGRTFSDWMTADLGGQGEYEAKAIWWSLGALHAPGRLFEFRCSDPVEFTAYLVKYNEERP